MAHDWKSVDPGCNIYWCATCGALGEGLGKDATFYIRTQEIPEVIVGQETPCGAK